MWNLQSVGDKPLDQYVEMPMNPSRCRDKEESRRASPVVSFVPPISGAAILMNVQRLLEECCFDFAKKRLPLVLQSHGWECASAVEVTKWTRILAKHTAKLPTDALKLSGAPFNDILSSMRKLRHTAVHRLPTTARGIEQLIQSALALTEALHDPVRSAQLEELHCEIESKIEAMELSKNVLEDGVSSEMEEIRRQREALQRKEEGLVANMVREDQENKSLIGCLLEEQVQRIFCAEIGLQDLEDDQDYFDAQTDGEEVSEDMVNGLD